MLLPFEYNGLAQRWTLEIKQSENPTLDFSQIISLGVRFRFSQRRNVQLQLLHAAQCPTRPRGAVLLIQIWDNFFETGQPPFIPSDRIASLQIQEGDFEAEHRENPTLREVAIMFVPKVGETLPPIHFHLACD